MAHKAGARGVPLETALSLLGELLERIVPTESPARQKQRKQSSTEEEGRKRRGRFSPEIIEREREIIAYLKSIGEGGARADRIAEEFKETRKNMAQWLWRAAQRSNETGIMKVSKGTYAYQEPQMT